MAVWYAFGLLAGMAQAVQAAVNAQLRAAVQSPLWAALLSFVVGTLGLALLILATRASIPAQWPAVGAQHALSASTGTPRPSLL